MIKVEDWAEIRRLHRAEGVSISEIARRLQISRNTVRSALSSDRAPKYQRPPRGSLVDAVEPRVRALLVDFPRMPATVIAERIEWPHSLTILKDRIRKIRPEYVGVDPADRTVYEPGEITQCDLWFPDVAIPVGAGQTRTLPVLVMAHGYSRFLSAVMLPSRQTGDLLSGMWQLIAGVGRVTRMLVWDREAGIGGSGRVTAPAAAFAGTLATRIRLAPRHDPEFKGVVERGNGYLETSFLPGRRFTGPHDFNAQLADWLTRRANTRRVRSVRARPVDLLEVDYAAMLPLPPMDPPTGLSTRVWLGRDYYVRVDTSDYSVDPRYIGRYLDVTASPAKVTVFCDGQVVARHERSWAKQGVITDRAHAETAKELRREFHDRRRAHQRGIDRQTRHHTDGHTVVLRALPDYDALFGVDFDPTPAGTAGPAAHEASEDIPS
ncbi:IS21 family transposase [Pseudonocardia sp. EC080625-04]|uniref:IS21 family transposase n=1 Tax=Pseudonocardia sp. EC080625-04 TaxID=1096868 RepID=UPI0011AE2FFC|nr:IS21 family transposase [Pseudonocardia sp. EC080625-04]